MPKLAYQGLEIVTRPVAKAAEEAAEREANRLKRMQAAEKGEEKAPLTLGEMIKTRKPRRR